MAWEETTTMPSLQSKKHRRSSASWISCVQTEPLPRNVAALPRTQRQCLQPKEIVNFTEKYSFVLVFTHGSYKPRPCQRDVGTPRVGEKADGCFAVGSDG